MRGAGDFDPPDLELLPEDSRKYAADYNSALAAYFKNLNRQIELLMSPNHAAVAVPTVAIDAGSSVRSGTATQIADSFVAMALPNTATDATAVVTTALSYTGRGILQRFIGMSQIAAATSTAAGFFMRITLDGTIVYQANVTTNNNRIAAVVGSINYQGPLSAGNEVYWSSDDANGLPFNTSCLLEFSSLTAGQGVTVGWRVLKKA